MGLSVQQRVQKGINILDQVKPDWLDKIDLATLSISSLRSCILGQVFHDDEVYSGYGAGKRAIRAALNKVSPVLADNFSAQEYGFDGHYVGHANGEDLLPLEGLQEEWVEQITARRNQTQNHKATEVAAYLLWEQAGRPWGACYWSQAEALLNAQAFQIECGELNVEGEGTLEGVVKYALEIGAKTGYALGEEINITGNGVKLSRNTKNELIRLGLWGN